MALAIVSRNSPELQNQRHRDWLTNDWCREQGACFVLSASVYRPQNAQCLFGWGKRHGTMRKTKHRGIAAVAADFMLNLIAYNLVRIPKLIAA